MGDCSVAIEQIAFDLKAQVKRIEESSLYIWLGFLLQCQSMPILPFINHQINIKYIA